MKNHIVFKFAAILLAAFVLMTALGSGLGIVILSRYDLYNRTVEEGYQEELDMVQQDFAEALVFRFASMELGNCPSPLIDDYYGDGPLYRSFRWGRYSYSIRDQEGNILVGVERDLEHAQHYEIPVENGRFICLLSKRTAESADPNLGESDQVFSDADQAPAVKTEPVPEKTITETEPSVSETAEQEETEQVTEAVPPQETETTAATEKADEKAEQSKPSPATDPEAAAPEETAEQVQKTLPATEPVAEAPAAEAKAAEPPAADADKAPEEEQPESLRVYEPTLRSNGKPYYTRDQYEAAFTYKYYDYKQGAMMEASLCFANTSDYIVDLYLAPDAMYDYQIWDFLHMIGPWRGALVGILGGSLLIFAMLMAYLFCAAGRKPGTDAVEAGGFNRLPVDLYAVAAGAGIYGAYWLVLFGYSLFQNTLILQTVSAAMGCFLGCILVVVFLFACAAQFKMGNGFWWKNSLLIRLLQMLASGVVWICRKICAQLKKMQPGFRQLGQKLHQTVSLMPVSWQWILATGLVMLVLCLTIASRKILLVILGVVFAVAVVLYGGYSFGILLDGVKKMRRGDLKTKIDSQSLLGSFKDFAQELNGLADVAGTAADKQVKSERMKTELITNVSHDIKTPLTSIINYVDLMEKPHTPEQQEDYLEVLSRQSQRLKKLIDDLMEMSKASTGNIQTDITRVNATEAVLQALGEFADKLDRADLVPVFHPSEREITMMADGRLVWRVLSNLLGNVVKYALPGTRVYLDLMELEEDVVISVKNVSREELNISSDELMERFVRGDVSRNTEGSGLGLNIAKSLMELQHGQLDLLVDGDLFKVTLVFPKN